MATQQKPSTNLPAPLRTAAAPLMTATSALRKVPGAGTVGRVAGGALDKIGAVSPRGRRIAVYTGAGVLGVAGVVEWPVALTGAAVAWLTQPRRGESEAASSGTTPSGAGGTKASAGTKATGGSKTSTGTKASGTKSSTGTKSAGGKSSSGTKSSTGRGKSTGTASKSRTKSSSSRTSTASSRPKPKPAASTSTARRGRTTKS